MRERPKKADYVLYSNDNNPIAILEAKDNNHTVSFGLQQALTYARMLDVPFAYSSNGDAFYEHDFLTGLEWQLSLVDFPSPNDLITRYQTGANNGHGLNETEKEYSDSRITRTRKPMLCAYYQRNAVNRMVEAIARGQDRLLLVMATGTGKHIRPFRSCTVC